MATFLMASAPGIAAASSETIRTTETDTASSRIDRSRANDSVPWDLTIEEQTRVETLLHGIRGALSDPRISPIEVLGIHATSDAERRRYAERWARLQIADAERVLAFERAYRSEVRKLLAERTMIDQRLLAPKSRTAALQPGDRLLFFTRADCAACEALRARVLNQRGRVARIDIYLTDQSSPDAIRAWAREQGIDPAWVRAKEVTLNADDGLLERLSARAVHTPYVLRQRGFSLQPIVLLSDQ